MPKIKYNANHPKILSPQQMLKQKEGNCLSMSVYLCCVFKEYNPTLILYIYNNAIHAETILEYNDVYVDFIIHYNEQRQDDFLWQVQGKDWILKERFEEIRKEYSKDKKYGPTKKVRIVELNPKQVMSLVGRDPVEIIIENQKKEHKYQEKPIPKMQQNEIYITKITGQLELNQMSMLVYLKKHFKDLQINKGFCNKYKKYIQQKLKNGNDRELEVGHIYLFPEEVLQQKVIKKNKDKWANMYKLQLIKSINYLAHQFCVHPLCYHNFKQLSKDKSAVMTYDFYDLQWGLAVEDVLKEKQKHKKQ